MSETTQERKHQREQYTSSPPQVSASQPTASNDAFHSQIPSLDPSIHPSAYARQPHSPNYTAHSPLASQSRAQNVFATGRMRSALPDHNPDIITSSSQAALHNKDGRRGSLGLGSHTLYTFQQNVAYSGGYPNPASFNNLSPQGQYPAGYVQSIGGLYQQNAGATATRQRLDNCAVTQYQQLPPQYYYVPGVYDIPGVQGALAAPSSVSFGARMPTNVARDATSQGMMMPGQMTGQMPSYVMATQNGFQGSRPPSHASSSSTPRGPPRKPKQSGFALWVGNLPQGANIVDLKDHFSTDATLDIESLFLISKSNCAFVNYRTEAACAAAMQRFHDSRFQGVRLVCRLRRGPTSNTNNPEPLPEEGPVPDAVEQETIEAHKAAGIPLEVPDEFDIGLPKSPPKTAEEIVVVPEKFFIIKSLTLQDLEMSVRTGIWATQAHNEQALNNAFKAANNVYLIFSANKSGEYFGYARMLSEIKSDTTEIFQSLSTTQAVQATQLPRTIVTPKTATAPKGRIIDDAARGTIFWEADLSDDEAHEPIDSVTKTSVGPDPVFGKPFHVEWQSTSRVPFFRTRGLRNAWNSNREVKIARDGTELEPGVGRRLVQLFHRTGSSVGGAVDPALSLGPTIGPYTG